MREGKTDEVVRLSSGGNDAEARMLTLYLRGAPDREIDDAAQAAEQDMARSRDSEPKYWVGSMMSYCGRRDAALRLLRQSVDELGQTVGMVTHDANAAAIADRIVVLSSRPGRVVAELPVAAPRPRRVTDDAVHVTRRDALAALR